MGGRRYYTLIASLPALPHFEKARHLPINPQRLNRRLAMLGDEDHDLVTRLAGVLRWQRQQPQRDDAALVAEFEALFPRIAGTPCGALVEGAVSQRTVVVALRRRQRGLPAPAADEAWGLGPRVGALRRNWEHPEFGLGAVFPWLTRARELLAGGRALELERLLTGVAWDRLARSQPVDPFRFEALLVYLFRWSLLEQWLSQAADQAGPRFDQLVTEAIGEHDGLLH